ncbi:hypothetical protein H0H93_007132 [Arthromyces matolae]|nr:hypothetical protein H0H93_007132 [Arthromyces matolae]
MQRTSDSDMQAIAHPKPSPYPYIGLMARMEDDTCQRRNAGTRPFTLPLQEIELLPHPIAIADNPYNQKTIRIVAMLSESSLSLHYGKEEWTIIYSRDPIQLDNDILDPYKQLKFGDIFQLEVFSEGSNYTVTYLSLSAASIVAPDTPLCITLQTWNEATGRDVLLRIPICIVSMTSSTLFKHLETAYPRPHAQIVVSPTVLITNPDIRRSGGRFVNQWSGSEQCPDGRHKLDNYVLLAPNVE